MERIITISFIFVLALWIIFGIIIVYDHLDVIFFERKRWKRLPYKKKKKIKTKDVVEAIKNL